MARAAVRADRRAHFLWRYSYYGEWFPNTYYAKFVRPWWDVGLRYLAAAGLETGLYLLLPLAAWAAWARWRERRDLAYALPLLIIAPHAAHIARIGGDTSLWRPLDFYWPLLALPAADGIARAGTGAARLLERWKVGARFAHGRLWAVAFLDSENASWVLAAPGMPALLALSNKLREPLVPTNSARPVRLRAGSWFREVHRWRPYEDMERGLVPDDAMMSIRSAGIVPYYMPDLTFVDWFGLNDWVIARNPVARPNNERSLFHDRFPPPGYLESRVNFEVGFAERNPWSAVDAEPYAAQISPGVWMPFDAPSLEWAEERFDSFVTASGLDSDLDALVRDDGRLAVSSHFDIYEVAASDSPISGERRMLVYLKEPCAEEDANAQFFLHLIPADASDLPEERRRHGFDNLDFAFRGPGRPNRRALRRGPAFAGLPGRRRSDGTVGGRRRRVMAGGIRLGPRALPRRLRNRRVPRAACPRRIRCPPVGWKARIRKRRLRFGGR